MANRPVVLAVRKRRVIDGELFNAESMGSGRVVKWNTVEAADVRAQQIRDRGFQARRIGRTVYVGDIRKSRQGSALKPRAEYDWHGATAADTRLP